MQKVRDAAVRVPDFLGWRVTRRIPPALGYKGGGLERYALLFLGSTIESFGLRPSMKSLVIT